jgi:hypothetical protein
VFAFGAVSNPKSQQNIKVTRVSTTNLPSLLSDFMINMNESIQMKNL